MKLNRKMLAVPAIAALIATGGTLSQLAMSTPHATAPVVRQSSLAVAQSQPPYPTPTGLGAKSTITLSWAAVPGVGAYEYEIGNASGIVINATNVWANSVTLSLSPGTYSFRVVAHISPTRSWSAWTPWQSFVVGTPPPVPAPPPVATQSAINWSGYNWDVRGLGGTAPSAPGPNYWDNTTKTVNVLANGDLQMNIWNDGSHWRTGEVDEANPLGYGTYKWVVDSSLGSEDLWPALGLFTYDSSPQATQPFSENDIEFSRWGVPGSAQVWLTVSPGATGQRTDVQDLGSDAPYTATFVWQPGHATFAVTGAGGETIASYTSTTGVQAPANAVPVINWYLTSGHAPANGQTQTVDIHSFTFTS